MIHYSADRLMKSAIEVVDVGVAAVPGTDTARCIYQIGPVSACNRSLRRDVKKWRMGPALGAVRACFHTYLPFLLHSSFPRGSRIQNPVRLTSSSYSFPQEETVSLER